MKRLMGVEEVKKVCKKRGPLETLSLPTPVLDRRDLCKTKKIAIKAYVSRLTVSVVKKSKEAFCYILYLFQLCKSKLFALSL